MATVDDVFAAAMSLPPPDRFALAERLVEALDADDADSEFDGELQQVLADRIAAYRRGEVESLDADEVLDELERSLDEGTLR